MTSEKAAEGAQGAGDFDPAAFGLPTSFGRAAPTPKAKAAPSERGRGRGRGKATARGRGDGAKGSRRPRTSDADAAEPDSKVRTIRAS